MSDEKKKAVEAAVREMIDHLITRIDGELGENTKHREEFEAELTLIHESYDADLAEALGRWFSSQHVTTGKVVATMCYMLAVELYYAADKPEDICGLVESHSNYIHHIAHILYHKNGPAKERKKDRGRRN
jgi:hypothetical protein